MKQLSVKNLTVRIALIQGFYWMIFCPIFSYSSVYLLSKGFSNQQIGWVLAINSIIAVFLQPLMGSLVDRSKKIPLKGFIAILAFIPILLLVAAAFLPMNWIALSVIYILTLAMMQTLHPLINSLTFECVNAGYEVSYGFTRAMGSITFAILSSLIGLWLNNHSPDKLPLLGAFLFAMVFLMVLIFPRVTPLRRTDEPVTVLTKQDAPASTSQSFLKKYDGFLLLILGLAFTFTFHTIINSYLVQIMTPLGAKDSQFGLALTIAAFCELPAFFGFNFIVSKINSQTLLKYSGIFYALRSVLFFFAASIWMVNLGQALQGITYAVIMPAAVYFINHLMKDEDKVKGQTWITGGMTLGSIIGSLIGGWLLDRFNVHSMLAFGMAAAIVGALLMVIAIRKPKAHNTAPLTSE